MAQASHLFLVALVVRALSLISQTFFQPDEFYQALEPAHHLVFGYGYLTWEWRDLPELALPDNSGVTQTVLGSLQGGRLRGWSWPGCFALIYWILQKTGLDGTTLIVSACNRRPQ
jgi:GPI mannosyltransferase 3